MVMLYNLFLMPAALHCDSPSHLLSLSCCTADGREKWMEDHETTATFNIAETCAASISVEDLENLAEAHAGPILNMRTKLVYGDIRGADKLRANLSGLYSAKTVDLLSKDNILITNGAIAANFIVFYSLISRGDHVICHYPTYQQLYSVPASLGAEISFWKARPEKGWRLDTVELEGLLRPNTKMIIINNPQNPTGAVVPKSTLARIVEIARARDIIILIDEVYRPLFHSITPMDPEFPPSLLSMSYSKTIATGSLSKAYAMAGIRVGWIASRSLEIIEACVVTRDHSTISVSLIDSQIATFALGDHCIHSLLSRNIKLAKVNIELLENFVEGHRKNCEWVKPQAGTTAFVKFTREGQPIDDVKFCEILQEKAGVMFCPGNRCFAEEDEFKGYVRMGYVCETQVLREGLDALSSFMLEHFAVVPLAS